MARRLMVLWAARHRRREWDVLCEHYRRRIERDTPVDDRMIKARAASDDPGRLAAEAEALRAALPDPCWSVVLDPRGKRLGSQGFAAELARLRDEWPHPVAFLVGSDLGLDPGLVRSARFRLSLGPMLFGHELARLVLYEQIYRALAMEKGIKYHRA